MIYVNLTKDRTMTYQSEKKQGVTSKRP
jgi:hypothetical protein